MEEIFLAEKPAPIRKVQTPAAPGPCPDQDGDDVCDRDDRCPNTPAGATVDQFGCWAFGSLVLFNFDKSVVKPEAYPMLNEVVEIIRENPGLHAILEGHTDSVGTKAYNQKLSERRADAVMQYVLQRGIPADRLSSTGYGEMKPKATNDTEEGRDFRPMESRVRYPSDSANRFPSLCRRCIMALLGLERHIAAVEGGATEQPVHFPEKRSSTQPRWSKYLKASARIVGWVGRGTLAFSLLLNFLHSTSCRSRTESNPPFSEQSSRLSPGWKRQGDSKKWWVGRHARLAGTSPQEARTGAQRNGPRPTHPTLPTLACDSRSYRTTRAFSRKTVLDPTALVEISEGFGGDRRVGGSGPGPFRCF